MPLAASKLAITAQQMSLNIWFLLHSLAGMYLRCSKYLSKVETPDTSPHAFLSFHSNYRTAVSQEEEEVMFQYPKEVGVCIATGLMLMCDCDVQACCAR
jgi:hypothetical protein